MIMDVLKDRRIIILDIETTGFSRDYDHIIEIGCVEYVDGKVNKKFSSLFSGGKSKSEAIAVHGITDKMREHRPTFEEFAEPMAKFLSGEKDNNTIIIGHNVGVFDLPFIQNKLNGQGFEITNYDVIDTLKLARLIQKKDNTLQLLCEKYDIQHGNHRALGDTESTLAVFEKLADELEIYDLDKFYLLSKMKKSLTKEEKAEIDSFMSF